MCVATNTMVTANNASAAAAVGAELTLPLCNGEALLVRHGAKPPDDAARRDALNTRTRGSASLRKKITTPNGGVEWTKGWCGAE